MKERFEFIGSISWKKLVIQNAIAFFFALIIFLMISNNLKFTLLIALSFNLLLISLLVHKIKASKIILTELECKIFEVRLFGLIKIYRHFEIENKEKDTLINYFELLKEKENEIQTFTVEALNKLLKYHIVFKNKNIKV